VKRCGAILALLGCGKSPAPVEPVVDEPKTVYFDATRPPDATRWPAQPAIDCPSRIGVVGRITGIGSAGHTEITVAVGEAQGVEDTWLGMLQLSPRVTCAVDTVELHVTKLLCEATPDQIGEGTKLVLLCAP